MLNPLVFAGADRLSARARRRRKAALARALPAAKAIPTTHLTDHTILVGYGRVGSLVGERPEADGRCRSW